MITGISNSTPFTSTYKAIYDKSAGTRGFIALDNYSDSQDILYLNVFHNDGTASKVIYAKGKEFDADIESILASYGVKFEKYDPNELLTPESIDKRIKKPESASRNSIIAYVNPDKLNELTKTQTQGNIDHCRNDYNDYYKKETKRILETPSSITAPTMYIIPDMAGSVDDTVKYIKRYGSENLNPDSLLIDFSQRTDEPDHCLFFAMEDAGMKEIPVCVDPETYKIGKAIGLITGYKK